jgi:hypothetical protein
MILTPTSGDLDCWSMIRPLIFWVNSWAKAVIANEIKIKENRICFIMFFVLTETKVGLYINKSQIKGVLGKEMG